MDKSLLIAGNNPSLATSLSSAYKIRNNRMITVADIVTEAAREISGEESDRLIWDARSVISTKTLVMKSANNAGGLDTAFLIFSPQGGNKTLHDMDTGEIERTVDTMLKGCIYLSREIIKYFMKKGRGSIGMVLFERGLEVLPPVEASLSGAFRALTESLFQYYHNEPIRVYGFYSDSSSENSFADFIVKIIDDNDRKKGRWYNYSGRSGLFSFGRS